MSFDAYHKWLGIPPEKQPPHYYQLLGISVNEQDSEVIETAAQRQRSILEENLHGTHRKAASQLIFEIEEAELTLLNPELREEYDRKVRLVLKRQKRKQSGHNLDPDSNRPAGEGSGLLARYVGIVSVLLTGFLIMYYFAYQRPRTEEEKQVLRAQPINLEKEPPPANAVLPVAKAEPVPPPAPIAKTEAESLAWIFSVGGKITTNSGQNIERAADLPSAPVSVKAINLAQSDVTDETLPNILPLTSAESLILTETKVSDQSIPVINQLQRLEHLFIAGTNLSGSGLAQLSDRLNLKSLYINNNFRINNADVKNIIRYPELKNVSVAQTSITDQGLRELTRLNGLTTLQIHLSKVDDQGLALLQSFPDLQILLLGGPTNTEQAVMNTIQNLDKLRILFIFDVPLTDAGINSLANQPNLEEIKFVRTQITDDAVNRLKAALPDAKIVVEN